MLAYDEIGLPLYNGLESAYEDVVYSFLRGLLEKRGYSLKVKRSGYPQIDSVIRSGKGATHGRGSCDGYLFSGRGFEDFFGLLELESSGKLEAGITQIQDYAESFTASTLDVTQKAALKNLHHKELLLIVFDGQRLWVATYSLTKKKYTVVIDREAMTTDRDGVSKRLYARFPQRNLQPISLDEKQLIDLIANLIRGHEALQKNKALVMTVLASIYGATQQVALDQAVQQLTDSQDKFDSQILDTYKDLKKVLGTPADQNLLTLLYAQTAPKLHSLSHEKGMDLYGYIYEELATKDTKKEQGEYYTPRHTIRPVLAAIQRNYLKWEKSDLKNKVVFDPFCGSGGFLYEYIRMHKAALDLSRDEVDAIASSSVFGADKNSVRPAYLNLYLIGDGSANLRQVRTSINWRQSFMYEAVPTAGARKVPRAQRLTETAKIQTSLKKSKEDLGFLLSMYSKQFGEGDLDREVTAALRAGAADPVRHAIEAKANAASGDDHGLVDLLVTNVPYGKISNPVERFADNGQTPYGNSLEANSLRECIDFLRPAVMQNGVITKEGGIGAIVVPDSILENPTNAPIREYLISRCDVLAVIGLPPFTFSPYAMEKTYILVIRKIAPGQYDVNRDLSNLKTFMYYSLADGKANSVNRFPTKHMVQTEVVLQGGIRKKVAEFCHNDFDPCFDTYFADKSLYLSKLERAWTDQTLSLNPDWDQERLLEEWTGEDWKKEPGRKWGYFTLQRTLRTVREQSRKKTLEVKLAGACEALVADLESGNSFLDMASVREAMSDVSLSASDRILFDQVTHVEVSAPEDGGAKVVTLFTSRDVPEIVLNPDDSRYLGQQRHVRDISNVLADLTDMKELLTYETALEYFQANFVGHGARSFVLRDEYSVLQGTQFSKEDAYNYPGRVPVFTAATDGPAYDCAADIPGKTLVTGPGLIWSRKGAKAGTIQLFLPEADQNKCYITDVSGIIKAKPSSINVDWHFLRMFLAGQVRSEIQAQDNNAQLNKTKLEGITVMVPAEHEEIGKLLKEAGI